VSGIRSGGVDSAFFGELFALAVASCCCATGTGELELHRFFQTTVFVGIHADESPKQLPVPAIPRLEAVPITHTTSTSYGGPGTAGRAHGSQSRGTRHKRHSCACRDYFK